MAGILTSSLADITPRNLANDPEISRIITALDPHISALSLDSYIPAFLADIDTLPDEILDALAVQFHADFYGLASDTAMKREIIKSSLTWHMKKGTKSAIISALSSLGIEAEFIPWWDYDGQPYTFRLNAEIRRGFSRIRHSDDITRIITRAVNESKSARSYMEKLNTSLTLTENLPVMAGKVFHITADISTLLPVPKAPEMPPLYWAGITASQADITLNPHYERKIITDIHTALISQENWDNNIGVDLGIMQELLLQFEQRIFSRIDDMELHINAKLDSESRRLDAKIDSVIEQLRWKGFDEEL
ncbi:MAG: phage tail protein I [Synergistaceae bacterium]|nr:phage tail protein I [Synergistaceae bacterium]MBQ6971822.1 phage tail protein I [Synergistaceae bacterium]